MAKKIFSRILLAVLLVVSISAAALSSPEKAAAAYNANYLCSDSGFVNTFSLNASDIQALLVANGSFLKNFSENGRSAAQIIYDAAHGYGDASGTFNGIVVDTSTGTVNPIAILATIQKEEGLIYGVNAGTFNQTRVDWAMGYGYTDDIIYQQYQGFTKQIEWGAWQLRYNYERAAGHGFSDYQVGQTVTIDDQSVTFSNRSTAALYRYTPHLQGNQNFSYYFDKWGGNNAAHVYKAISTGKTGLATGIPGTIVPMSVTFKNTSNYTWGPSVHLATDNTQNQTFLIKFNDGTWLSTYRIASLPVSTVAPGESVTFTFNIKIPNVAPGQYQFFVRLVDDGHAWFTPGVNGGAWWYVNVLNTTPRAISTGKTGLATGIPGTIVPMSVTFKNTSNYTWNNSVQLATDNTQNQTFLIKFNDGTWLSTYRIASLPVSTVAPGATVTFTFNIKIPNAAPGRYQFFVRLVDNSHGWFTPDINGGAWWYVTVLNKTYKAQAAGQSGPVSGIPGTIVPMSVTFKNTSNYTWGPSVHLATDNTQNYTFLNRFNDGTWLSSNRIAGMSTATVAPGASATFTFNIKIPSIAPGRYQFFVRMVDDGYAWFTPGVNGGAWWYVTVN